MVPLRLPLVEALTRYAEELLRQEEGATAPMDDLLEVQSGLQKVRVQKKAVQARLEHAESESTNLRKELEDRARAKTHQNTVLHVFA